jgi:putative FmdB family regulatory protein
MPTYEYECEACGKAFELFQQMSDPVKRKCPKCGKARLRRLIGTGAGVIFKGGGFYETDYRSENYKKAADAEKKAAEPVKPDATADAKPEPKVESKSDSTQSPVGEKSVESAAGSTKPAVTKPSRAGTRKPKRRK